MTVVRTLVRQLRLHQWSKNLLVVVPLLLAHEVGVGADQRTGLVQAVLAFLSFSVVASAVYTMNDLSDRESDAQHPRKRHRPLASGTLSPRAGQIMAVLLLLLAVPLAAQLSLSFITLLVLYLASTTLYTFWLKRVVLVDVLVLAGLYTLRIIAGGEATSTPVSTWLLMFSLCVFTSLAFLKRYTELRDTIEREGRAISGRGYRVGDAHFVLIAGTAIGYLAVLVFAFYLNGTDVTRLYDHPTRLWAMVPVLLYWINRMWLKAHRGEMHDDPIIFALRDRATYILGAVAVVIVFMAGL